MRKDDLITVTIEDLSSEGLGVGHYDGMAFFIKDTVIGDVAEAKIMKLKKTYGYARLTRSHHAKSGSHQGAVSGSASVRRLSDPGDEIFRHSCVLKRQRCGTI